MIVSTEKSRHTIRSRWRKNHVTCMRFYTSEKPVHTSDQGRMRILERQLQLRQSSHNDIIIYELAGKWQNTFISYPARDPFVLSFCCCWSFFFLPGSQLERNLQLIKIGKFLFIFRSSRPEYMRIPYIQEEKRANTYETNVAAKKKKKTNDGRWWTRKGKTAAQQNFCRIGEFLWINKMKNELNDCVLSHIHLNRAVQDDGREAKFEIFVLSHTLNLIGFFRVRKQTESLRFASKRTNFTMSKMRCDAIVIGYAVHIHCKIDAFCTVYNYFFSFLVCINVEVTSTDLRTTMATSNMKTLERQSSASI